MIEKEKGNPTKELVQAAPRHGVLTVGTFALCAPEAREVDYVVEREGFAIRGVGEEPVY